LYLGEATFYILFVGGAKLGSAIDPANRVHFYADSVSPGDRGAI